jgi:hypothetical protein
MEVTLKQPREDVAGADRDDDLLSFVEKAIAHREALIGMARLLYDATRVGDPAPVTAAVHHRVTNPRPGDLVVEVSVLYGRTPESRIKGLGILVEKRKEWYETDEEYAEALAEGAMTADEPRFTDTAWYVQYGPSAGDICRWTECKFIALPHTWEDC